MSQGRQPQWVPFYNQYGNCIVNGKNQYSEQTGDQQFQEGQKPGVNLTSLSQPQPGHSTELAQVLPGVTNSQTNRQCASNAAHVMETHEELAQVRKEISNAGSLLNQTLSGDSSVEYSDLSCTSPGSDYKQWSSQPQKKIQEDTSFQPEYQNSTGKEEMLMEKQKVHNMWLPYKNEPTPGGKQIPQPQSLDYNDLKSYQTLDSSSLIASQTGLGQSFLENPNGIINSQYVHQTSSLSIQGHQYLENAQVHPYYMKNQQYGAYNPHVNMQQHYFAAQTMDHNFVNRSGVYTYSASLPQTSIIKRELEKTEGHIQITRNHEEMRRKMMRAHSHPFSVLEETGKQRSGLDNELKIRDGGKSGASRRIFRDAQKLRFQKPKFPKPYSAAASNKPDRPAAPPPVFPDNISPTEKVRLSFQNMSHWNVNHYYSITAQTIRGTSFQHFEEFSKPRSEEEVISSIQPVVEGYDFDPYVFINLGKQRPKLERPMTNSQLTQVYRSLLNGHTSVLASPPTVTLKAD